MRIKLSLDCGGWSATFSGDESIRQLFGTNTIPTAFGPKASYTEVFHRFAVLNPGATIYTDYRGSR